MLYSIMIEYQTALQFSSYQFSSVTDFFLENNWNSFKSWEQKKSLFELSRIAQAARFDLLTEALTININVK